MKPGKFDDLVSVLNKYDGPPYDRDGNVVYFVFNSDYKFMGMLECEHAYGFRLGVGIVMVVSVGGRHVTLRVDDVYGDIVICDLDDMGTDKDTKIAIGDDRPFFVYSII